jgi:ABC-2 type transport system ATP-binding protein
MDEADELSDRLAIIDHGVIVAQGTPRELKRQIAGDVLTIGVKDHEQHAEKLTAILAGTEFVRSVSQEPARLRVYVTDGESALPKVLRLLDSLEIGLSTATLSVPTLDDVFLQETGRSLRPEGSLEGA